MRKMVFVLAVLAALVVGFEPAAAGTPEVDPVPNGRMATVHGVGHARAAMSHRGGDVLALEAISFKARDAADPVGWPIE